LEKNKSEYVLWTRIIKVNDGGGRIHFDLDISILGKVFISVYQLKILSYFRRAMYRRKLPFVLN